MDLLLGLDLDWLCIAAEVAAGLLLVSIAWMPGKNVSETPSEASAVVVDWEPLVSAYIHAATATARSLAVRPNTTDEQRLRDLLENLPTPCRDRLTGIWNANGMDRLISEWSLEPELNVYPSCYVSLSLSNVDDLIERQGPTCVEIAIRAMSESLVKTLGGYASISHYQPHRFLLHCIGKSSTECNELFTTIATTFSATEFFSFHDEAIPLVCELNFWYCDRGVQPEELMQLLDESVEAPPLKQEEFSQPVVADSTSESVPEKPFSIDDLAPFPCPWDNEPEGESVPIENTPAPLLKAQDQAVLDSPVSNTTQAAVEGVDSKKVAGLASPEQIEELLSQLNGETVSGYSDESSPARTDEPATGAEQFSRGVGDEDHLPEADLRTSEESLSDTPSGDRPLASHFEVPPAAPDVSKSPSIYTDDIEESLLKDDLASLFAAVRSSAVGDFGYAGKKPGPEQKPS